ncbi:hypothetical protein FRB91_009083 [Serendipita sp. 411]|nr:hypothetical protein FRB91_009083 [Serendipita sp. 411]
MPPKSHFVALEGPDFDREHAEQLAVRLDLLPYTTESEQQANDLLETFIAKLIASTNAKDADSIVQWGVEAMQEWSVLRRSISRPRRAVLVRFFYHLTNSRIGGSDILRSRAGFETKVYEILYEHDSAALLSPRGRKTIN